eukprot:5560032-Amphidinium_carterae.1
MTAAAEDVLQQSTNQHRAFENCRDELQAALGRLQPEDFPDMLASLYFPEAHLSQYAKFRTLQANSTLEHF